LKERASQLASKPGIYLERQCLFSPIRWSAEPVFPSARTRRAAFDPVCGTSDASRGEKFRPVQRQATGAPLWVIEVIAPTRNRAPGRQVKVSRVQLGGRPPTPPPPPKRAVRVAVHPGGVNRDDRHAVREPAAWPYRSRHRHTGTRPRPTRRPETREVARVGARRIIRAEQPARRPDWGTLP